MEERREMNVNEFINTYVTISYLQEQRIFKLTNILKYIERCCLYDNIKEYKNVSLEELINETKEVITDMINDGIISYVYNNGQYGMYRINDKVDYMALTKQDKDYVADMIRVFLDINGGAAKYVSLTPSKTNIKK